MDKIEENRLWEERERNRPHTRYCMENGCKEEAVIDYNDHGHWVCMYHYDKLNDEFDEEYR